MLNGVNQMTIEYAKDKMMRIIEKVEESFGKDSGADDIRLLEEAMESISQICLDADILPANRNEILGRLDVMKDGLRPSAKSASNQRKHVLTQTDPDDQLVLRL